MDELVSPRFRLGPRPSQQLAAVQADLAVAAPVSELSDAGGEPLPIVNGDSDQEPPPLCATVERPPTVAACLRGARRPPTPPDSPPPPLPVVTSSPISVTDASSEREGDCGHRGEPSLALATLVQQHTSQQPPPQQQLPQQLQARLHQLQQPQRLIVQHMQPKMNFSLSGDPLELMIAPGDIILVRGSGRLAEIGNVGGLMGHVMIVLAPPRAVQRQSVDAHKLQEAWPVSAGINELFSVRTVESTRRESGLYECETLLYVDRQSRRLIVAGEVSLSGEVASSDAENAELWQSPEELRSGLRIDVMNQVLVDMRASQSNWSVATGFKAVFKSASARVSEGNAQTLQELQTCWDKPPICTSIVIAFWQRYLVKLAEVMAPAREPCEQVGSDTPSRLDQPALRAVELILQCMPLKADRALPGDLMKCLKDCGWVCLLQVPRVFRPALIQPTTMPMPPLVVSAALAPSKVSTQYFAPAALPVAGPDDSSATPDTAEVPGLGGLDGEVLSEPLQPLVLGAL
mmetsp:Transcript_3715/g.9688  ORF Transcript_3715/g.9688 Transcript_3715/m.9688 type:complete len:517 (+) Transcript_3715:37-1587(+)